MSCVGCYTKNFAHFVVIGFGVRLALDKRPKGAQFGDGAIWNGAQVKFVGHIDSSAKGVCGQPKKVPKTIKGTIPADDESIFGKIKFWVLAFLKWINSIDCATKASACFRINASSFILVGCIRD